MGRIQLLCNNIQQIHIKTNPEGSDTLIKTAPGWPKKVFKTPFS